MKEFTNVTIHVTSFAVHVNLLFPSWISCQGAWFEAFWDILWEWFLSKKEPKEGERVGARSLSWKSGWNTCTISCLSALDLPKNFFPFPRMGHLKFANFVVYWSSYFIPIITMALKQQWSKDCWRAALICCEFWRFFSTVEWVRTS